jgi:hypothetical protein
MSGLSSSVQQSIGIYRTRTQDAKANGTRTRSVRVNRGVAMFETPTLLFATPYER